ncbi:type II secretion system F family protein [Micromonospora sp. WMMC241]|uniref:type II secretion system F family protein n=1 Tax=Micromonospora sp. WMMC241 TaxID=3015159 RepID=UPI002FC387BE
MTGQLWLACVLLAGAAAAVAWPARAGRVRRRTVLDLPTASGGDTRPPARGRATGTGARGSVRPSPRRYRRSPGDADRRRRPGIGRGRARRRASLDGHRPGLDGRFPSPDGYRPGVDGRLPRGFALVDRSLGVGRRLSATRTARHVLPAAAVLGGGVGAVLGGPVAALVLAAYGTLAARAAVRRRAQREADRTHRRDLDRLAAAAADLRAGLPAGAVLDGGTGRIARLCHAAVRLADRTGAPLADLLERIEADARAADRGLAAAAAQAAGSRATAWLLAALPLGGIGLGYAIGVDPVAVLLHTPVGGGSATAAVVLQVGGLLWAERLGTGPGRAA